MLKRPWTQQVALVAAGATCLALALLAAGRGGGCSRRALEGRGPQPPGNATTQKWNPAGCQLDTEASQHPS